MKKLLMTIAILLSIASVATAQTWSVRISWPQATDPNGDLAGYHLWLTQTAVQPNAVTQEPSTDIQQGGTLAPIDNFTFTLQPGTTHFWVSAYDAVGNETFLPANASVSLGSGPGYNPEWPDGGQIKVDEIEPIL